MDLDDLLMSFSLNRAVILWKSRASKLTEASAEVNFSHIFLLTAGACPAQAGYEQCTVEQVPLQLAHGTFAKWRSNRYQV